jgi:outer membrane protein assembly factor BamB
MNTRIVIAALLLASSAHAENWPSWRGPTGQGHSAETDLPLKWDENTNIRWKAPLPEPGNASPIVWGDRVFITQAIEKGTKRGIMCFDRATGKQLWFHTVHFRGKEPTHDTNPFGSATCATDGERIIASLGSAGLLCVDFAGKELWRKDLGEFIHIWGNASSPVTHGDLVYFWGGPGERQFLIALNKTTGDKVWRHDEPGGKSGEKGNSEWLGSWTTPVIAKVGDHDELILAVPNKVRAFDPKSGKELWWCDGLGPLVYTTPVVSDDGIVVAMAGYGGAALAVKAGGSGDVTKDRLWQHPRQNPQRIGSAVIIGEHAYLMNEQGLASCFELKTGHDLWNRQRVTTSTWGSLVHAGSRLYVTNVAGETIVLKADPKLEMLARNKLPDRVLASIAVSDGEIFIRGYKYLWCIK